MRNVPVALQAHLDSGATTVTYLLRIEPVTPGFDPIGITLLDRDVVYDDGDGEVTYLAKIGMVPANLESTSGMDVDNTESQHLFPEFDLPISEADMTAGVLDFAKQRWMLVNYEDLSMGHVELTRGTTGRARSEDGQSFFLELVDQSKQLMQSIVEKDSITCRAIFGSQPLGTPNAVTQKFPCGFDAESLLVNGQVDSVGIENTITFSDAGLGAEAGAFVPGMVYWLTGSNAGRANEVESQDADGVISLTFDAMFPIQVGDTFQIRPDCTKWKEGPNGCKTFWGADWVLHYRGEPYIPISDADAILTPGATVGAGLGGSN